MPPRENRLLLLRQHHYAEPIGDQLMTVKELLTSPIVGGVLVWIERARS
jgi:hypothetical protein